MITDVLNGTRVFVDTARDKVEFSNGMFGLAQIYLENGLGMKMVPDSDNSSLSLEDRFVQSGAPIAFVSALPYLFYEEELAESKIIKARAVILTTTHFDFVELNETLRKGRFLTMDLDALSINQISPLVSLFQQALKNI